MTAPWHRGRRHHAAEAHRPDPRFTPDAVPDHVAWKVRLGDQVAHAYSSGPGWMRSVCRAERWTVTLADVVDQASSFEICQDCALLVDGAPGEITEAFGS